MSNADRLATILKKLGDAHYQAADELIALAAEQPTSSGSAEPGRATGVPVSAQPAPASYGFSGTTNEPSPFEDLPVDEPGRPEPQGSLAMCPVHKVAFVPGNYGYSRCTQKGGAEGWVNARGYCTISEKNVAKFMQTRGRAA